jgi:uncharacterized protein (TIGR03437 family)
MRMPVVGFFTLVISLSTFGQTYTIATVAGSGSRGFSGDNGPAPSAQLDFPAGVVVDSAGNLYIADSDNNRVRKVANGVITTVAGNGLLGFGSCDNGPATSAKLSGPAGVSVDSALNLYIADESNNCVRKVSNGVITALAGGGSLLGDNGPATDAQLNGPSGVAVDSSGNLYIADLGNNRVRKVANGVITTVAGNGTRGFGGDNGPAISAQLAGPVGVAVDSAGNLYIAEAGNNRIRKVSNGVITTVAGSGATYGFSGDYGPATAAQLNGPHGVAVDPAGNLYISDTGNDRIRKVSNGVISTVAGDGTEGFDGDNGPATSAQLAFPSGVAVDSAGNVYIADAGNNRIRILTPIGPSCTYSVGPPSLQAPAAGGNLTFSIQTAVSCPWMVSGLPNWITISGSAFGTSSSTITLVVSPNSGAPRSATIVIAGVSVTVSQPVASLPTITAVVNAASFQNGPISPGEIVTIGGTGLGPPIPAGLTLDQNGKVSTLEGGVQVLFSGFPAPLTYVSSTQINAVVPYEIQGLLSPLVQVTYQGQKSNSLSLTPTSTAPALFTLNGTGTGPAAAINQDQSYNAPNNPAPKGSYIVLYMTGEGQTSPLGLTGQVTTVSTTTPLTPQPILPVAVLIGGQPAYVAFYGEAPGIVSGVMQLNVQIPTSVPSGSLPVSVSVGGSSSQNGVTVSVQ